MPTGHRFPHLEATESPSLLDIAWAAGIYEGEGWISTMRRESGSYSIKIGVGQKDDWILLRLQALFGGGISEVYNKNAGECYVWSLYSSRAMDFLNEIFQFLSPRRQAQIFDAVGKTTFTVDPS
jgi:hypothetical protein